MNVGTCVSDLTTNFHNSMCHTFDDVGNGGCIVIG